MYPALSAARPCAPCQIPPPLYLAVEDHAALAVKLATSTAITHPRLVSALSEIEPQPMKMVLTPLTLVMSSPALCLRATLAKVCIGNPWPGSYFTPSKRNVLRRLPSPKFTATKSKCALATLPSGLDQTT